jgi:HK97 family phage prohead protease
LEPTRPAHLQFELAFPATTLAASAREENGVTRYYISGTASSTMEDLKGSVISAAAQVIMLDKLRGLARKMSDAKSGMTGWLSHNYLIPEDTLGAFTGASLATRNEDGQQFIDLDIELRCVDFASNPRAEAAYKQVQDGIRHGWSIGAYFKDIRWLSDDEDSPDYWKYEVTDIELLEISLVGIPANQRAWVRDMESAKDYAVKRAERIVSESCSRQHKRELVQRSIVEQRGIDGAERLAMAEDFRERSKQAHLSEANVHALERAATALESRDDGGELSPDDMRDRIRLALTHFAKAGGHGCCVTSMTHLARGMEKCIDCLSVPNGGAAEPLGVTAPEEGPGGGDEDPNAIMAIRKLEPKAGDIIVLSGMNATQEQMEAVRAQLDEAGVSKDVVLLSLPEGATVDTMLDEKRAELTAVEAALAENVLAVQTASQRITDLEGYKSAEEKKIEDEIGILKAERDQLTAEAVEHESVVRQRREDLASELEMVRGEIETARAERDAVNTERDASKAERETVMADIAARKAERLGRLSKSANPNDLLTGQSDTYMKPSDYKATYAEKEAALKRMATGSAPIPKTGRDFAISQEQTI